MNTREALRRRLAFEAGERIARWTDSRTSLGDFEDREWTLEIFGVPTAEKRGLHRRLWSVARDIQASTGISIGFVLHSPEAVDEHYRWVLAESDAPMIDSAHVGTVRTRLFRTPWGIRTEAAGRRRRGAA